MQLEEQPMFFLGPHTTLTMLYGRQTCVFSLSPVTLELFSESGCVLGPSLVAEAGS